MFNFLKNKNSRHEDMKQVKSFIRGHRKEFIENKQKISQDIFDVTIFFFDEILDIYESMDILIQKGHFKGCLPMARLLLENSINLQYIYKQDSEKRAKDFKLASAQALSKRFATLDENTEEFRGVKYILEDQLRGFVKDKKTLKEKADEVNFESLYKDSYKRLSGYVHSAYRVNWDFDEERPYNLFLKRLVFSDTALVTLEALKSICEKYDLDGGVMFVIDEPGYKGDIAFATNPKKMEENQTDKKATDTRPPSEESP